MAKIDDLKGKLIDYFPIVGFQHIVKMLKKNNPKLSIKIWAQIFIYDVSQDQLKMAYCSEKEYKRMRDEIELIYKDIFESSENG